MNRSKARRLLATFASLSFLVLCACPGEESPADPVDPACSDECTAGTKLCPSQWASQLCGQFDDDECLELSTPRHCPSGESCLDGECVAGCVQECAPGTAVCFNRDTVRFCGNFDADDCRELGGDSDCAPGTRCEAGACVPDTGECVDECTEGVATCEGDAVRTCGQYDDDPCTDLSTPSPCGVGEGCRLGVCQPACNDACAAGAVACEGNGVKTCAEDAETGCLAWGAPTPCPSGETCSRGRCAATCTDDCAIEGATCNAEATGVVRCGQLDDDRCLDQAAVELCGAGHACRDGACVSTCTDECQPGQTRCGADGVSVQSCGDYDQDPCRELGGDALCQGGAACANGACESACADECLEGAVECVSGQAAFRTCGQFDGDICRDWSSSNPCLSWQVCSAGTCVLAPPPGAVIVNEVLYDSPGSDTAAGTKVFVELWGPPHLPLDGFTVVGVNGAGGADYATLALDGQAIGADGFFVIAHPSGAAELLALAQMTSSAVDLQNGPDSVQVRWHGQVVDALAYGSFGGSEVARGEGTPAPAASAGKSLSRSASHGDSNDNAADFAVGVPTPRANVPTCASTCPVLDQTECVGAQVRVCADPDGDGCSDWSAATDCPSGQRCSGSACVAFDPCSPNPCTQANKTVCTVSGGDAVCSCNAGYQADGSGACVPIDPCNPNPCTEAHRGVCQASSGVAVCLCDPGYGENDSGACAQIDPCTPNPCTAAHQTVCTAIGPTTAVCSCDPGYVPSGTACVLDQTSSCANSHAGDLFEPDECVTDAKLATLPANQSRTLSPAADVDWIAINALAAHVYSASVTATGFVPALFAYDSDGTTVLASSTPSSGTSASVRVKLAAGRHYLKVRASSSSASGSYTLAIADADVDDHGDTMDDATPLAASASGGRATGGFQVSGDVDVFAVPAVAGRIYRVEETSSTDVSIRVFTATATLASWRDPESFTFLASATETVYLAVRQYSGYGATFSVAAFDLGTDDHGNTPSAATPLSPSGAQASGSFQYPGDVELFAIPVTAGRIYRVEETTATDVYIALFSNSSTLLAWRDPESHTFRAEATETLYFGVQQYSGFGKSFAAKVTDLGTDDHSDAMAGATPLAPTAAGAEATGVFQFDGDPDVFAIPVVAQRIYRLEETSSADVRIRAFTATATLLAWVDGPESFTFRANETETVYLAVAQYSGFGSSFTVKATDLGLDDHSDAMAGATPLAPTAAGAEATGVFQFPGDTEVFAVPVVAGRIYRVEETAPVDAWVRVFTASTTLLAWTDTPESFTWKSTENDPVYFAVRQYSGFGGSFVAKAVDLGLDDFGDSPASATLVAMGSTTTGSFQFPNDWEFVSAPVVAGHVYRFVESSPSDVWVRLEDETGTVVTMQDTPESVLWKADGPGTARFGIGPYAGFDRAWQIELADLGPDDHADDRTGATPLAVGTAANGDLQFPGDPDYFKFTVTASNTYAFQCLTTGLATKVSVFSSGSTTALASGSGSAGVTFTVPGPGDYYLLVRAYNSGQTGTYTVLVRN